MSGYEIKIGKFEGPLDLLLYLVQKEELEAKDISVAEICDQFLAYLDAMEAMNLSIAGDFLFMASRLMSLKAREMLPREDQDTVELIELDEEREALIQQMLEYQRFKEVTRSMREHEESNFGSYSRGRGETSRKEETKDAGIADAGVWQLYQAFKEATKSRVKENIHTIELDNVTIEDCQQFIDNFLRTHGRATFEELIRDGGSKLALSVTFMAMLEMVKTDEIVFRQANPASSLWVYKRKDNVDFLDEMAQDHTEYTPDPTFQAGLAEKMKLKNAEVRKEDLGLDEVLKAIMGRINEGQKIGDKELDYIIDGNQGYLVKWEDFHLQAQAEAILMKEAHQNQLNRVLERKMILGRVVERFPHTSELFWLKSDAKSNPVIHSITRKPAKPFVDPMREYLHERVHGKKPFRKGRSLGAGRRAREGFLTP